MGYAEQLIEGPEGRVIEVATVGDPGSPTVVVHHGTPGSTRMIEFFADEAQRAGLFVVLASRAGYGRSTRRPGRSIASVVEDTRACLDALGRDTYVAVGWSGGGPHALACAALDAPRCAGAVSLAGVVPIDVDFDWTEGMGPENIEEFALSREGGERYEAFMATTGEAFAGATPDTIVALFGDLLSAPDLAALADPPARTALADATAHGFVDGWRGYYDDDRAFFSPWGFDVGDITAPVAIWYGDEDLMVPPTHGAWLAAHVPGAVVRHWPAEGHVSLVTNHLDELVGEVRAMFEGA